MKTMRLAVGTALRGLMASALLVVTCAWAHPVPMPAAAADLPTRSTDWGEPLEPTGKGIQGPWTRPVAVMAEPEGAGLSAAQASRRTGWRQLVPRTAYDFLGPEPHWLAIPVRNPSDAPAAQWLQIDYPWLSNVQAQLLDLQGRPIGPPMWAGTGVPVGDRALRTSIPSFPVMLAPGQEALVMLRTEGVLWWPDRLLWVSASEGARLTAVESVSTALALGAGLVLALVIALQRTAAGAATAMWIALTAASELVHTGHIALLPGLDSVALPWSAWALEWTRLSHVSFAVMAFTLLGLNRTTWTVRSAAQAVVVGVLIAAVPWWTSNPGDRLINLPLYLAQGAGWAFLFTAWRTGMRHAWPVAGLLAVIQLHWLVSHGWPHTYGRFLADNDEWRLLIKISVLVLLVLAHERDNARRQRQLQDTLLDAERRQAAELEQTVSQRTHELRRALDEAKQASLAKSRFVSSMSHEMRTPMNAILGFSQIMMTDPRSDPSVREGAQEVYRAGSHLLTLIDEVLDLSKVEAGRLELTLKEVPLLPLVQECVRLVQPLALERQVQLSFSGLSSARVIADEGRLRQVLLNLLGNAVKYNRPQGSVQVSAEPAGGRKWRVTVRDDGPGISQEAQARLFQPFERGDARFGSVPGTGIGLALSRQFLDLMGGDIGVQSREGAGAAFWLELPAARIGDGARAVPPEGAPPVASYPMSGLLDHHRVLCIDDNPINLKLLERMLRREPGLEVHTCHESKQALSMAEWVKPSLILVDINMPNLDGYALLRLLRGHSALCSVPVLAVTADAMTHDVQRGREAGFDEYLTKPLELQTLMEAIVRQLKAVESSRT